MNKVVKQAIKGVLSVEKLNDPEEQERRYSICKSCKHYNAETDQCMICKCYMEIKTGLKTNRNPAKGLRIEVTHCPIGKWGDEDKAVANLYRERDGLEPIP